MWLDVIAIYGSSAKLTNNPMKYDILNKNIEEVYDKIREYSLNNQISEYPTFLIWICIELMYLHL